MRSMQWQLGMLGTVSAFAYRHRETKKNLCRGGRSQDLPNLNTAKGSESRPLQTEKTRGSGDITPRIAISGISKM